MRQRRTREDPGSGCAFFARARRTQAREPVDARSVAVGPQELQAGPDELGAANREALPDGEGVGRLLPRPHGLSLLAVRVALGAWAAHAEQGEGKDARVLVLPGHADFARASIDGHVDWFGGVHAHRPRGWGGR